MDEPAIIFLDIDGVLVTRACYQVPDRSDSILRAFDPRCVLALQRIVSETQARIVVSSTWRQGTHEQFQRLRDHIAAQGITAPVVGRTPEFRGQDRGDEIADWLYGHPRITRFVILDDDDDMGHLLPKLVRTDFEDGLTADHARRAVEMLNAGGRT